MKRRTVLHGVTASVVAGIAGCTDNSGESGGDDGDDGEQETSEMDDADQSGTGGGTETSGDMSGTDSGESTGDDTGGSDSDGSDSDGTGSGGSSDQSTATSEIDQIEIVDHGPSDEYDFQDGFTVELMLRNAGEQEIMFGNYFLSMQAFDADGNRIEDNGSAQDQERNDQTIAPDETFAYPLVLLGVEASQVSRYEVSVECSPFDEAPYC